MKEITGCGGRGRQTSVNKEKANKLTTYLYRFSSLSFPVPHTPLPVPHTLPLPPLLPQYPLSPPEASPLDLTLHQLSPPHLPRLTLPPPPLH